LAELQQAATAGTAIVDKEQAQEDFLCFFEDLYMEFSKFGPLDALHVCDNLGDHMIGTLLFEGLTTSSI
jgi:splicing factor U2AF 35 kDa subunit